MWIERLEVIGFGNLTGQRIEFDKSKVNIILEPNEYGKSTIAEAIWAILYDYPPQEASENGNGKLGHAKQPLSGAGFKGYLDLNIDGRRLRVIRDFVERSVKILDLSKDLGRAQSDVTSEFIPEGSTDVGLVLTGMGRDLFRSTCLVGQRELDKLPFGGDRSLSNLLLHVADSAGTSTTAAAAIERLNGLLEEFPYRGKTYKISELLVGLETGREMLQERLSQLESEKNNVSKDLQRLSELDVQLAEKGKHVTAEEYFQLVMEVGELDNRLMKAQERIYKVENLRASLEEVGNFEHFPIGRLRTVEEVWTKRASRLDDMTRLMGEIEIKEAEARERDLAFRERSEGLSEFTIEDAQAMFSLGKTLQTVFGELDEIRHRREGEINRVRAAGVNLETLSGTRRSLLALESKDLDDAHVYHAMITNARDKISEHQRSAWRARTKIDEIDEQRTHWLNFFKITGGIEIIVLIVSGAALLGQIFGRNVSLTSGDPLVFLSVLVFCIFAVLACVTFGISYYWRNIYYRDDEEEFLEEEEKQSISAQDLQRKILTLEQRMEVLARKAGVAHGGELVRCIQEYATAAAQLKDLDVIEQMWASRDAHAQKLITEIAMYFQRAGRGGEVNPRSALELADAIIRFQDDYRQLQAQNSMLDHKKSELRFLHDEVRDMDRVLHEEFMQARVEMYQTIDIGYANYLHLIDAYRRWEAARDELTLIESETTSDMMPDELPMMIERLEGKRSDVWERMQEIIIRNPAIAMMKPPVQDSKKTSIGREITSMKNSLDVMRHERESLGMHIRAATKNYDSFYLKTMEELETLERDLETLKQTQASIRLAVDTFKRLAEQTHAAWAKKLTEISREMLRYLATDYESLEFDANLRLSVRRKGTRESLGDWQLVNQVSGGVREQVHLLARMAVARFLSKDLSLPIVLDEPFSEFDDERFTRIMKFLLASMLKNNQIILFSCHQQRHKWLLGQLELREREQVHICHLESLKSDKSDSPTASRR